VRFSQSGGRNEIEQIQVQAAQNGVGLGGRELALSLEHVMKVRLREADHLRQASFGDLAASYPAAKLVQQAVDDVGAVHMATILPAQKVPASYFFKE